jgi:ribosome-associated protein
MGLTISINNELSIPERELTFHFTRSGGPGGQNVNKVSTRVELSFDLLHSSSFNDDQRERLLSSLKSRVGADGVLRLAAQESRSQWRNREEAIKKFVELLRHALRKRKKRLPTAPTRPSRQKRLKAKLHRSRTKKMRGRFSEEG